jgi:hypothetical protein
VTITVNSYLTISKAASAHQTAAEKSEQVPGFTPISIPAVGQKSFAGSITQGMETHVGLGARANAPIWQVRQSVTDCPKGATSGHFGCSAARVFQLHSVPAGLETRVMRKVIKPDTVKVPPQSQDDWLDLEDIATVEVTSEDPLFPIESALAGKGSGWRAAGPGKQVIRIVLDDPRPLRRIRLEFVENDVERTQEFTLRWSEAGGPFREFVRQQWNFSPQGSTNEIEDYWVKLDKVSALELTLEPALAPNSAYATLAAWRVA